MINIYLVAALTPAIDIFSFGMCALEMAALEIQGNGDTGTLVTDEHIARTIEGLEDAQQKDFISKCLHYNPADRLNARELLFHSLLFEVHSLKLLAAHCLVNTARKCIDIRLLLIKKIRKKTANLFFFVCLIFAQM